MVVPGGTFASPLMSFSILSAWPARRSLEAIRASSVLRSSACSSLRQVTSGKSRRLRPSTVMRAAKPSANRLSSPVASRGMDSSGIAAILEARNAPGVHRPVRRCMPTLAKRASTVADCSSSSPTATGTTSSGRAQSCGDRSTSPFPGPKCRLARRSCALQRPAGDDRPLL